MVVCAEAGCGRWWEDVVDVGGEDAGRRACSRRRELVLVVRYPRTRTREWKLSDLVHTLLRAVVIVQSGRHIARNMEMMRHGRAELMHRLREKREICLADGVGERR